MKKGIKVLFIIILVLVILAVVLVNLLKSLMIERNPLSLKQFEEMMKSKNYMVVDVTNQFSGAEGYLDGVYLANNSKFQIEFFDLSNEENAIGTFNTNKNNFEASKENSSTSYSVNLKDYSVYSVKTGGKFKYVSRVKDTVIYLNIDAEYQEEVEAVLKELGY